MPAFPKKLILIGLDGAAVEEVQRFVDAGCMPNTKALMERGTSGNLMPVYPTLTPANWTTISTGAWPSTHGITDFWLHLPGTPLNQIEYAFDTHYCKAEYIWDAAERAGKRSILVKYESSWPPTHKTGFQVEGLGPGGTSYYEITGDTLFSTNAWPLVSPIKLTPAKDWANLPESQRPPLETRLVLSPRLGRLALKRDASDAMRRSVYSTGEDKVFYALVTATQGKGYDRVTICNSRNADDAVCCLAPEVWSDWHIEPFSLNETTINGAVRFKVLKLSPDAKVLEIFVPQVFPTTGYFSPDDLSEELIARFGPFLQNPGRNARQYRWIGDDDFMELVDYHHRWLGGAAHHLMQTKPWDLCFVETHVPDYINHLYLNELDPLNKVAPELRRAAEACFEQAFASIDRMIGQIIQDADDETLIIVVADHGGTATTADQPGNVSMALERAGLLTVIEDPTTHARRIDWTKTRAVSNMHHIWVNLKGRDPDGIVEPEDYEKTCSDVIRALYDYRDPKTGRPIVSLALTRDDARILGLHGDRTGDVVWAIVADYDQAHGSQLSNAVHGISSIRSTFIMAGPGVKQGHTLQQNAFLTAVAPTIAFLMRFPVPRNAEGPVLYDALENPNALVEEIETLQEERDRWKAAYEAYQGLTHVG